MDDDKKKPVSAPYPPGIFTFGDYVREMAQEEEAKRRDNESEQKLRERRKQDLH